MNKTAILHIPESQYSFAYGDHELRIRLRAARGDLIEMGVSAKKDKRKKQVDSIAAAYILESYLKKIKK